MTVKDWIEQQNKLPDIVRICFDDEQPQGPLFRLLYELDKEVTGYTDEITDENGDNPEEYEISPHYLGYNLEFGEGVRYTSLDLILFRDQDILGQWLFTLTLLSRYKVKIKFISAGAQRTKPRSFKGGAWGTKIRGTLPGFIDHTEARSIYGLDMEKAEDRQLFRQWLRYVIENFNNPGHKKDLDYYEYTGTLGHDLY